MFRRYEKLPEGTRSVRIVWSKVSQEVVMLFWVAGVALCDIPCVSEGMCVHDRRGSRVVASTGEAAKNSLFRGVTDFALHTLHSVLCT